MKQGDLVLLGELFAIILLMLTEHCHPCSTRVTVSLNIFKQLLKDQLSALSGFLSGTAICVCYQNTQDVTGGDQQNHVLVEHAETVTCLPAKTTSTKRLGGIWVGRYQSSDG